MDFFNQGIPLGRWFRITVILHWTFLLYAANKLFFVQSTTPIGAQLLYMFLLFGTVLTHEFGHALSCRAVGGQADQIVLWPLGGIAFVQPPMNPTAWLITTVCGPLVNAVLWPASFLIFKALFIHARGDVFWSMYYADIQVEMHQGYFIFDRNLPWIEQAFLSLWQINKMLLLFNLIPAYPMDGGRILQEVLWFIVGYGRSLMIAGMIGTAAGVGFVIIGLGLWSIHIPVIDFRLGETGRTNMILVVIGILAAMQSFAIYRQAQQMKIWRKN